MMAMLPRWVSAHLFVFELGRSVIKLWPHSIHVLLQILFDTVLSDPLVTSGATEQLQRIRFLALKNLAGVVARDPTRSHDALHLYSQATLEDGSDVSLWDRYGTLAARVGEWSTAKVAFRQVLLLEPGHPTCADKLLQLLLHVGDYPAAASFADVYLRHNPSHPLSRQVKAAGAASAPSAAALVSLPALSVDEAGRHKVIARKPEDGVEIEQPTWSSLMDRCVQLLSGADTATAEVRFVLPKSTPADKVDAPPPARAIEGDAETLTAAPREVALPAHEAQGLDASQSGAAQPTAVQKEPEGTDQGKQDTPEDPSTSQPRSQRTTR